MDIRKERILPFFFISIMMFIISFKLVGDSGLAIIGWWIMSSSLALAVCIPFLWFWNKPSAHIMPLGAAIALFMHEGLVWHNNSLLLAAALALVVWGLVASSRLQLKAHNFTEIVIGTIIGILVILPLI